MGLGVGVKKQRKRNLDRVSAYVAILQPLMRIAHWEIIVGKEQAPAGTSRRPKELS